MTIDLAADAGARERLGRFLEAASGAARATLGGIFPLRGGAIQENWGIDVELHGGAMSGRHALVLRADAASRVAASHGRAQEFALLKIARAAGVTVPEPLWCCADTTVIGRAFYVMRRVPGVAAGHRIVKDLSLGGDRDALAERLGLELARIHSVTPQSLVGAALGFLTPSSDSPGLDRVQLYRRYLDELGNPHPVIEWGLRWLEINSRKTEDITLVHQDFRTGNYLIDERGLTAILDWEFCAWGEPMADLGWFCAKCWRFGAVAREAGGIASRAPFYRGYEAASGRSIEPGAVHYWEVAAHVRWAIIALQQEARHGSGRERSLELALTGEIVPELELEMLDLIEAAEAGAAGRAA
jgi:aminoglycoside phosphotransferase (APT) family kinase protein